MKYKIYQIVDPHEVRYSYMSVDFLEEHNIKISPRDYKVVYEGETKTLNNLNELLERLFERFNINLPGDYYGRSLSISDVIELEGYGLYYVNTAGFEKLLPDWSLDKSYLIIEAREGCKNSQFTIRFSLPEARKEVIDMYKEHSKELFYKTPGGKIETSEENARWFCYQKDGLYYWVVILAISKSLWTFVEFTHHSGLNVESVSRLGLARATEKVEESFHKAMEDYGIDYGSCEYYLHVNNRSYAIETDGEPCYLSGILLDPDFSVRNR